MIFVPYSVYINAGSIFRSEEQWLQLLVWFQDEGVKTAARINKVGKQIQIKYFSRKDKQTYLVRLDPGELTAMPVYEVGDKVRVYVNKEWQSAEVERISKKGYIVFWRADNRRWERDVTAKFLRPA